MATDDFYVSKPLNANIYFKKNDALDFAFQAVDQAGSVVDCSAYNIIMQAKDDNGNVVYQWMTDDGTITPSATIITFSKSVLLDTVGEFDYDIEIDNGTRKQTVREGTLFVTEDVSESIGN